MQDEHYVAKLAEMKIDGMAENGRGHRLLYTLDEKTGQMYATLGSKSTQW